jgi:hypothetical protein
MTRYLARWIGLYVFGCFSLALGMLAQDKPKGHVEIPTTPRDRQSLVDFVNVMGCGELHQRHSARTVTEGIAAIAFAKSDYTY